MTTPNDDTLLREDERSSLEELSMCHRYRDTDAPWHTELLRSRLIEARRELAKAEAERDEARSRFLRQVEQLDKLEDDLRRFGGHFPTCAYWQKNRLACDCGWSAVEERLGR